VKFAGNECKLHGTSPCSFAARNANATPTNLYASFYGCFQISLTALDAEVALGMSHKRRGAGTTGRDSASVKLLVKSRTIWALMARAYGRLD